MLACRVCCGVVDFGVVAAFCLLDFFDLMALLLFHSADVGPHGWRVDVVVLCLVLLLMLLPIAMRGDGVWFVWVAIGHRGPFHLLNQVFVSLVGDFVWGWKDVRC